MQVVERSALVTYTAAQMFALVNDVARYPEFLPWCVAPASRRSPPTERIAALEVARGVLRTEFTTRNTLRQDAQIHMQLLHGPVPRPDRRMAFRCHRRARLAGAISGRVRIQEPPDGDAPSTPCSSRCAAPSSMPSCCARSKHLSGLGMKDAPLQIEVAYAEPERAIVKSFRLAPRSRVADAMRLAALDPDFSGVDLEKSALGIFGRLVGTDQPLQGRRPDRDLPAARRRSENRAPRPRQIRASALVLTSPARAASAIDRGRPDPDKSARQR